MVLLSREVIAHIISEYGRAEVLRRLSDPFWFQAFGCVLGFDWHSSGVTTTVCGAIKEGLRGRESELGFYAAGGKGAVSRKTPQEIETACERLSRDPSPLVYASKTAAKVDSAAVQDGYQLYHHAFFFTAEGEWCVVQQGMNDQNAMARRYHWLAETVGSFVNEPHQAVCCDQRSETLNLVAAESDQVRAAATEVARQKPDRILQEFQKLPLLSLPSRHELTLQDVDPRFLYKALTKTYENMPADFEGLLGTKGVGPKTLRALALVAELIYGSPISTRDPARFAFAHGGKDGTPFPVDRATYDRTIDLLDRALQHSTVDRSEKVQALKRLSSFAREQDKKVIPAVSDVTS